MSQPPNKLLLIAAMAFSACVGPVALYAQDRSAVGPKLGPVELKRKLLELRQNRPDMASISARVREGKIQIRVATRSAELKRRAVVGIISAVNGNVLTVTPRNDPTKSINVNVGGATVIKGRPASTSATLADLVVGVRIAAVGPIQDRTIMARMVHILMTRPVTPATDSPTTTTP